MHKRVGLKTMATILRLSSLEMPIVPAILSDSGQTGPSCTLSPGEKRPTQSQSASSVGRCAPLRYRTFSKVKKA